MVCKVMSSHYLKCITMKYLEIGDEIDPETAYRSAVLDEVVSQLELIATEYMVTEDIDPRYTEILESFSRIPRAALDLKELNACLAPINMFVIAVKRPDLPNIPTTVEFGTKGIAISIDEASPVQSASALVTNQRTHMGTVLYSLYKKGRIVVSDAASSTFRMGEKIEKLSPITYPTTEMTDDLDFVMNYFDQLYDIYVIYS